MIRLCPNCRTERPLAEVFCDGTVDSVRCDWPLSDVPITEPRAATPSAPPNDTGGVAAQLCPNGHPLGEGDLLCMVCFAVRSSQDAMPDSPSEPGNQEVVGDWRLERPLSAPGHVRERFLAARTSDGRRAVLTLYRQGAEPDPAIYEVLGRLNRDHVPEIIETGHWEGRAFEVAEELTGGTLADIGQVGGDAHTVRRITEEIGKALYAFAEAGLRHRDLRPSTVLVRQRDPLDLVITGFGSARLSELDLDIVSPLETSRYMAPEAVMGGVAAASDWWGLGMLVLEQVTGGACFDGISEPLFIIHVLTNGAPIPTGLDPTVDRLLRGLLARDRTQRWQWKEVQAWLAGKDVPAPNRPEERESGNEGSALVLGTRVFRNPLGFALEAARSAHWDEALALLRRGAVATWAEELRLDPKIIANLRLVTHRIDVPDDLQLAIALKLLNPALPLIQREQIINPGWLLDNPAKGYELITGPVPELLSRLGFDAESWLLRLSRRAEAVRSRAANLDVELEEESLRVQMLSTSRAQLAALWDERRRLMPDTDHPGLGSILDRPQITEEDLVVLVSAMPAQFRPRDMILAAAEELGARHRLARLEPTAAAAMLELPRRDVFSQVDRRIEAFARCGDEQVDAWADQFRLERRLPLEQTLLLLAVPLERWRKPAHQDYVVQLLEFFEKRVAGAILRGPLVRMTIGKTTPRVDIADLAANLPDAAALLDRLLQRGDQATPIDPHVFAGQNTPEQRLRNLVARTTVYQRDTGIDGLYLGFPFLLRRDRPGNVRPRLAPVLLWPVKLRAEVGGRGRVTVAFDRDREEVRLNPAFEGLLGLEGAARWRDAANELLGRSSLRAAEVMDGFGGLADTRGRGLRKLPGKEAEATLGEDELIPAAVLFHVEFLGQSIVEDLRHLKMVPPAGSALEAMLRIGEEGRQDEEAPIEGERFLLAPSDPSQEEAIARVWKAPGLLVQGPPGTGKSQTIVNLVADAIGRGSNVLVVCQKLPALEVVRKRLVAENLRSRLMMVTDVNRDRRAVIQAIRDQLEGLAAQDHATNFARQRQRETVTSQIAVLEAELDHHHEAFSHVDDRMGKSYRGILSELLALNGDAPAAVAAPILRRLLAGYSPAVVATIAETCGGLARDWLPARFEDSTLVVLKEFSGDNVSIAEFRADLEKFASVDAIRLALLNTRSASFDVEDAAPLRAWLAANEARLCGLEISVHAALTGWLTLFRSRDGSGGSDGPALLGRLRTLTQKIGQLDQTAHDARLFDMLFHAEASVLSVWIRLAERATSPVGFWGRLSPTRWAARRRLRALLASRGESADDVRLADLHLAARLEQGLRPIRKLYLETAAALGIKLDSLTHLTVCELSEEIVSTRDLLAEVAELTDTLAICPLAREADAAALEGAEPPFARLFQDFGGAIGRADARRESLDALAGLDEWVEPEWVEECRRAIATGGSTGERTGALLAAWLTIAPYQRFRRRAKQLEPLVLQTFAILGRYRPVLDALSAGTLAHEVRRTVEREALLGWKDQIELAEPSLTAGREEMVAKVERLATLTQELRRLNREHLASTVDRGKIGERRLWEDITKLQGPRAVRLREFVDRGSRIGLLALRPVWLVNPEVASQLLPRQRALFDVVIYDEASQIPVEYALPTLFRARIAMVSGDEKQMPPTSFFTSKVESDEAEIFDGEMPDEDATDLERDLFAETWNRREIKDCPDLLHLAAATLPSATLQIHYRSAYRELVAFSNAAFYRDELSVPVRHPDAEVRRVQPIHVDRVDGEYRDQTNPAEALRVADLLATLWSVPPERRPSVGVVTFNRKQADLVEEVLEARAEGDHAFREAYSQELARVDDGEDMAVFVKNVENVQGDERDIIIFSTTFGKPPGGSFRRHFGVLGQRGGERRLNVAVTRARQKVVVVTSIPVAEVSDFLITRREPESPRDYLQAYLEYARLLSDGELESARALRSRFVGSHLANVSGHENDGLVKSVEAFLRSLGHEPIPTTPDPALGVDFALIHPQTGMFSIGIECSAPVHRLLRKARAREIWRPAILSRAYPMVHRIAPHAWYHDAEAERERLAVAVERALTTIPGSPGVGTGG